MSVTGSNSIQLASEHVRMLKWNMSAVDRMGFARLSAGSAPIEPSILIL